MPPTDRGPGGVHEPRATYRLQLQRDFPFGAAEAVAPYLAALGISHVYLSPILQAAPGSTHGYDVVDPTRVDVALGGDGAYARFGETLGRHGLGQVIDIVPNHMAIGMDNPWWWDVLENGASSRYARHFDVDWAHPEPHLRDRVLLPILGDHYGRVLEAGELRLAWDGEAFTLRYHDHRLPIAPRSLDELLAPAAERAGSDELAFLADAFRALPPSTATDLASVERRHRDKEVLARRLVTLAREEPPVTEAIEAVVAATNADVDALDLLLERQNYRLAWWRTARRDLGYRRFFDVTTLAGLRMEDERVFEDTHRLVLGWLSRGVIDGVRVDHPDGLRDPEGYFRRLRWASARAWIVAEKILEPGEELRRSWPIAGTTGYDFLNLAQAVLVDPAGEAPLTELWEQVAGTTDTFTDVARAAKHLVLRDVLGSELGRLTSLLLDVLERHRRHRDHTRHDLHEALRELLAAFPVYRTYVRPGEGPGAAGHVTPEDEAAIRQAVDGARTARPDLPGDLFDVIADLLLLRLPGDAESEFVARFQQLTGPVMAKGVEDTAFYRYLRLAALNEVGGDPGTFARPVEAFHARAALNQERWPTSMLASATHDTKRGEDVRARLLVLSEIPGRWAAFVRRVSDLVADRRGARVDGATEYLIQQTVVGAWPIDEPRLVAYLTKAIREAKTHTTWTEPDEGYEAEVLDLARAILADPGVHAEVEAFVESILEPGRLNGLSQTLLKLTAPGIPDVYQGTELWDLSLVDPDNRRPVDFDLRRRLLDELADCTPEGIRDRLRDPSDPGLPKLHVVRTALGLRARRPDLFGSRAGYRPIEASGERAAHVIAFGRRVDGAEGITIVPRLPVGRGEGWGDTTLDLAAGRWTNLMTGDVLEGGAVPLGRLLDRFPVALLEGEAS